MKIKKTSWLYLALVLVLTVSMFAGLTGANEECEPCEPELVVELIAGQNMVVGTVTVTNDDEQVCVTYKLNPGAIDDGWLIYETHLAIATELDGIPQTKGNRWGTNPIPGQFDYGDDELDGVEEWTFCIFLEDLGVGFYDEVFIAVHAVVKQYDVNATSATIYGNIGGYEPGNEGQGDIWVINPIDRSETRIFECPADVNFEANWYPNALAYDEINNRLYFTTAQSKLMLYDFSSENDIGALKDASGDVFNNSDNVLGAAFGDGAYWYVLNRSEKLYRVDFDVNGIATERIEFLMTTEYKNLTQGDIVFLEDGILFGSSGTGASPSGGFRGFFTYDIANNDFNVVYDGGSSFLAPQLAWGLDADGEKVMYGTNQQNIWTIDTETGVMTPVTTDETVAWITENRYQDLASSISYDETWDSETAWGDGERFNERGNWGMYFKYKICEPGPDCVESCVDFCELDPGETVEGLGTVQEYLNIQTPEGGNAVKIEEGEDPSAYGAPNDDLPDVTQNAGIDTEKGGFSDLAAKDAIIAHDYTFTFAEDTWVTEFSLRMLDFGDYNPSRSKDHYASMTAYDSDGNEVDKMELEYPSDGLVNPRSSDLYGDLWYTGDAVTAEEGDPGNWIWEVSGDDIVRIELEFGDGFDPNIAFDKLCFTICK